MKRWITFALALCLLFALAAPSMAEAAASEPPSLYQVRYYFEHQLLPASFYDTPDDVLAFLKEDGPYELWRRVTESFGLDPTYAESDFRMEVVENEGGIEIARLSLPEPDGNTLCPRVYFVSYPETGKLAYVTVESDTFMPDAYFICGWTPDGTHLNFGSISIPTDDAALAEELEMVKQVSADGFRSSDAA